MRLILAVAVVLAGCAGAHGGSAGKAGARGPAGKDGANGTDGPHWVDAAGTDVTSGTEPIWFDADGDYWSVDEETGAVSATDDIVVLLYESADCTGDGYVVNPPAPRAVVRMNGAYYVRPDDAAATQVVPGSGASVDHVGCFGESGGTSEAAISATTLGNVAAPQASFVGPLHLVTGT